MKPRILFCTQTAHVLGGFQLWLDRICQLLPEMGWDVITGFAKGAKSHDPTTFREFYRHMDGVEIDGRDGTPEGRIHAVKKVIRKVRPDIVVPVLLVDANKALVQLKNDGSSIRHVYTYQGTHDWNIAEAERYANFIDLCCGCNVLATGVLLKRGTFAEKRLMSVPNGVPQRALPESRPLKENLLNLAYVGRISHDDKRVFEIREILDHLDKKGIRYYLRIAGDGPDDRRLRKLLSTRIENGTVEHMGLLHFDEIHEKIYSKTDVLLFPSPWEGWPLVIGEAISAGVVPLAAAYRGVASERVLVPGENAVIYQVGDSQAASEAICRFIAAPERLQTMSLRAYETSREFSWQRCAERWSVALKGAVEMEPMIGKTPPDSKVAIQSRLSDAGVPIGIQVFLRKMLHRQKNQPLGSAEWPYRDRDFSASVLQSIERDLLEAEQDAISDWPAQYNSIKSLTRQESR